MMRLIVVLLAILPLMQGNAAREPLASPKQEVAGREGGFAKRVVTTGLANPFQMVWGPDDYLWLTERTGRSAGNRWQSPAHR